MFYYLWKRLTRELVLLSAFWMAPERRQRLERWLRGKEEFRKLRLADCVVVSFGKSGRTWLRVLLSRFFQLRYGLGRSAFVGFDNLHRRDARIPRVFFTHDNYLRDYTGNLDSRTDFHDRRTVLLVRHPAEVAVFDFVTDEDAGLPKVIDFMNAWARELQRVKDLLIVRYEDLRADTAGEL